jgi:hypothetical protein
VGFYQDIEGTDQWIEEFIVDSLDEMENVRQRTTVGDFAELQAAYALHQGDNAHARPIRRTHARPCSLGGDRMLSRARALSSPRPTDCELRSGPSSRDRQLDRRAVGRAPRHLLVPATQGTIRSAKIATAIPSHAVRLIPVNESQIALPPLEM